MENYFIKLNKVNCEKSDKNGYKYISWSDSWAELKKLYPKANYRVYENNDGLPFFDCKYGTFVKVGVIVEEIEHIISLPVLDFRNKSLIGNATSFDINKAIMRALTKAIALHGIGLYVFRNEDLPETDWEYEFNNAKTLGDLGSLWLKSPKTTNLLKLKNVLKEKLNS